MTVPFRSVRVDDVRTFVSLTLSRVVTARTGRGRVDAVSGLAENSGGESRKCGETNETGMCESGFTALGISYYR